MGPGTLQQYLPTRKLYRGIPLERACKHRGSRWSCHREQNYQGRVSSSSASSLSRSRPGFVPAASGSGPATRPRLPTPILPRKGSWRRDPSPPCRAPRAPGRTAARGGCSGSAHSPGAYSHHRLRPTRPKLELDGDVHVPLGRSPGDVRVPSRRQCLQQLHLAQELFRALGRVAHVRRAGDQPALGARLDARPCRVDDLV